MAKKISSNAPSPRSYVVVPITIRRFEVTEIDKLIQDKRFKELWKPGECNRITEVTKAIRAYVKAEKLRLSTIERPEPLKRKTENGA